MSNPPLPPYLVGGSEASWGGGEVYFIGVTYTALWG